MQEHALTTRAEALVAVARRGGSPCLAVSPLAAQFRLIAELGAGVENLRVYTAQTLGVQPFTGSSRLLLSTVAGDGDPGFPCPLSDPGAVVPLLIGPYESIHLFASAGVANHHPLFRGLVTTA